MSTRVLNSITYSFSKNLHLANLKRLRKSAGLTQREVDSLLSLRPMAMFDYERGRIKLPIEVAVDLCNLYHCSLDDIYAIGSKSTKKASSSNLRFLPVLHAGLDHKRYYLVHHTLISDPVIMSELGINEVENKSSTFDELTKNLTRTQKKAVTVEILKYLNSLAYIDKEISEEEEQILKTVNQTTGHKLSKKDYDEIEKVKETTYFGNVEFLPTKALKRYLIWLMSLVANSDDILERSEVDYVKKVNRLFNFNDSDYEFIEKKIRNAHASTSH